MEVGGAVWTLLPGGCGGTRGTFSGGIAVSELGVAGEVGDGGSILPGAGGVGPFAVWLWEPGSTAVSESFMLGFVSEFGFFISA